MSRHALVPTHVHRSLACLYSRGGLRETRFLENRKSFLFTHSRQDTYTGYSRIQTTKKFPIYIHTYMHALPGHPVVRCTYTSVDTRASVDQYETCMPFCLRTGYRKSHSAHTTQLSLSFSSLPSPLGLLFSTREDSERYAFIKRETDTTLGRCVQNFPRRRQNKYEVTKSERERPAFLHPGGRKAEDDVHSSRDEEERDEEREKERETGVSVFGSYGRESFEEFENEVDAAVACGLRPHL